jgi:Protein of unknown function (DUF2846)
VPEINKTKKYSMRKMIIIAMVILISNSTFGQNTTGSADSSGQNGKVYFMRSTGFQGSATGFTVFIDDQVVCKLNNKRYSIHEVAPGNHNFSVQFAGKKSKEKAERIEIMIEPGKTYYIQLIFQSGLFTNNLYCQEVTQNSANKVLPGLEEDKKCL